jgi:hypothetical protein
MDNMDNMKGVSLRSSVAEYPTYVAATCDNQQSVKMRYETENIHLTQKMMVVLYVVDARMVNYRSPVRPSRLIPKPVRLQPLPRRL